MLKTVVIPVLSSIASFLVNKIPDTWKIIIGVFILMSFGLFILRGIGISESKAYSNSLQDINNTKFETMVKHNDNQFQLLRDDINSLRKQNSDIIKLLIKK